MKIEMGDVEKICACGHRVTFDPGTTAQYTCICGKLLWSAPRRQPGSDADVTAAAELLSALRNQGVLDRARTVKVGCVEVSLGPADLGDAVAGAVNSLPKGDPRRDHITRLLNIRDGRQAE